MAAFADVTVSSFQLQKWRVSTTSEFFQLNQQAARIQQISFIIFDLHFSFGGFLTYHLLYPFLGVKWIVRGQDHLQEDECCVLVSNHQTTLDVVGKL